MQTKSENIGYLTVEERWEALISQLVSLRGKPNLNEDDLRVDVLHLVKGLNLVQRFDWPKWEEPFPTFEQIKGLDLKSIVMQVTRICRMQRFGDGLLDMVVESGILLELCVAARELTQGQLVPSLLKNAS
jgi:Family of unknown function (DUF6508)